MTWLIVVIIVLALLVVKRAFTAPKEGDVRRGRDVGTTRADAPVVRAEKPRDEKAVKQSVVPAWPDLSSNGLAPTARPRAPLPPSPDYSLSPPEFVVSAAALPEARVFVTMQLRALANIAAAVDNANFDAVVHIGFALREGAKVLGQEELYTFGQDLRAAGHEKDEGTARTVSETALEWLRNCRLVAQDGEVEPIQRPRPWDVN